MLDRSQTPEHDNLANKLIYVQAEQRDNERQVEQLRWGQTIPDGREQEIWSRFANKSVPSYMTFSIWYDLVGSICEPAIKLENLVFPLCDVRKCVCFGFSAPVRSPTSGLSREGRGNGPLLGIQCQLQLFPWLPALHPSCFDLWGEWNVDRRGAPVSA